VTELIKCDLHDYIEIACLFHFEIRLSLTNGDSVQGIAETTETTADKREWLVLTINGQIQKFDLTGINSMHTVTANQHFNKIEFL
jgi:Rho-binding antiterminator